MGVEPCRPLVPTLLPFRPHPHVAVVIHLDVDDVRATADRAILDVLLLRPRRQVDGYDDLLAAGVADVAGLVLHRFPPSPPNGDRSSPAVSDEALHRQSRGRAGVGFSTLRIRSRA